MSKPTARYPLGSRVSVYPAQPEFTYTGTVEGVSYGRYSVRSDQDGRLHTGMHPVNLAAL